MKLFSKVKGFIDNQWGPVVRGWVFETHNNNPLLVRIHSDEVDEIVTADIYRGDLKEKGIHPTGICGFRVDVGRKLEKPVTVTVIEEKALLPYSRPDFKGKPIFFMHIAKTAGSSMNKYFIDKLGVKRAAMHIEGIGDWSTLKRHSFISGHINYHKFCQFFNAADYFKVTMVREPIKQLISHFYWVRHLSEPCQSEFLAKHPDIIRTISTRLAEIDFSDPQSLANYIGSMKPSEVGLFDNFQCRSFHPIRVSLKYDEASFAQVVKAMQEFDLVAPTCQFEQVLKELSGNFGIVTPIENTPRVNVNQYDYGFDFNNSELVNAVEPLIRFDNKLYQAVLDMNKNHATG